MPVCGEVIWVDIFNALNTIFCCVSLFQSASNVMLERCESDYVLPRWVVFVGAQIGTAVGLGTC